MDEFNNNYRDFNDIGDSESKKRHVASIYYPEENDNYKKMKGHRGPLVLSSFAKIATSAAAASTVMAGTAAIVVDVVSPKANISFKETLTDVTYHIELENIEDYSLCHYNYYIDYQDDTRVTREDNAITDAVTDGFFTLDMSQNANIKLDVYNADGLLNSDTFYYRVPVVPPVPTPTFAITLSEVASGASTAIEYTITIDGITDYTGYNYEVVVTNNTGVTKPITGQAITSGTTTGQINIDDTIDNQIEVNLYNGDGDKVSTKSHNYVAPVIPVTATITYSIFSTPGGDDDVQYVITLSNATDYTRYSYQLDMVYEDGYVVQENQPVDGATTSRLCLYDPAHGKADITVTVYEDTTNQLAQETYQMLPPAVPTFTINFFEIDVGNDKDIQIEVTLENVQNLSDYQFQITNRQDGTNYSSELIDITSATTFTTVSTYNDCNFDYRKDATITVIIYRNRTFVEKADNYNYTAPVLPSATVVWTPIQTTLGDEIQYTATLNNVDPGDYYKYTLFVNWTYTDTAEEGSAGGYGFTTNEFSGTLNSGASNLDFSRPFTAYVKIWTAPGPVIFYTSDPYVNTPAPAPTFDVVFTYSVDVAGYHDDCNFSIILNNVGDYTQYNYIVSVDQNGSISTSLQAQCTYTTVNGSVATSGATFDPHQNADITITVYQNTTMVHEETFNYESDYVAPVPSYSVIWTDLAVDVSFKITTTNYDASKNPVYFVTLTQEGTEKASPMININGVTTESTIAADVAAFDPNKDADILIEVYEDYGITKIQEFTHTYHTSYVPAPTYNITFEEEDTFTGGKDIKYTITLGNVSNYTEYMYNVQSNNRGQSGLMQITSAVTTGYVSTTPGFDSTLDDVIEIYIYSNYGNMYEYDDSYVYTAPYVPPPVPSIGSTITTSLVSTEDPTAPIPSTSSFCGIHYNATLTNIDISEVGTTSYYLYIHDTYSTWNDSIYFNNQLTISGDTNSLEAGHVYQLYVAGPSGQIGDAIEVRIPQITFTYSTTDNRFSFHLEFPIASGMNKDDYKYKFYLESADASEKVLRSFSDSDWSETQQMYLMNGASEIQNNGDDVFVFELYYVGGGANECIYRQYDNLIYQNINVNLNAQRKMTNPSQFDVSIELIGATDPTLYYYSIYYVEIGSTAFMPFIDDNSVNQTNRYLTSTTMNFTIDGSNIRTASPGCEVWVMVYDANGHEISSTSFMFG